MAAAFGLYTHIQSNRRRSIALLIGLFFLVYVMVYAGALIAEAVIQDAGLPYLLRAAWRDLLWAAPWATLATAAWMAIAYWFNQSMIDAVTGAGEVTRKEQPRLYNLLENLCISRGVAMPKLKVMDNTALNAFASGLNPKQYSITVTTGLLDHLNDQEVEAVLGHELTHIRNGDVRMLVIAVIIAGVIGFFAELVFRMVFQNGFRWSSGRSSSSSGGSSDRGKGGGGMAIIIAIAMIAVAWLLSTAIRFALSRRREFLADAGSVELTKNPDAMIMALRKIEGRGELHGATSAVMEMCVDNPREGFADLFATHPSIERRIKALIEFAGGRDPGPLDLPADGDQAGESQQQDTAEAQGDAHQQGNAPPKPFLPSQPPVVLGGGRCAGARALEPHRLIRLVQVPGAGT